MVMIYKRLWVGGCAEWPFTVTKKQSFTYALDAGRAIALLALANDCYNQVCDPPPPPTHTYTQTHTYTHIVINAIVAYVQSNL